MQFFAVTISKSDASETAGKCTRATLGPACFELRWSELQRKLRMAIGCWPIRRSSRRPIVWCIHQSRFLRTQAADSVT